MQNVTDATAVLSRARYRKFIGKNLKQSLIFCFLCVKNVWRLKQIISGAYSNKQQVMIYEEMRPLSL